MVGRYALVMSPLNFFGYFNKLLCQIGKSEEKGSEIVPQSYR